jgi:inhibitor of cysteine peptidase
MKIRLTSLTIFAVATLLAIFVFGGSGTAFAKGTQQQTGFRWQMIMQLKPDTTSAPVEAVSALGENGVTATVSDKQLVMNGQENLEQMRTALFDTASPWMDLLGGPVDLTLHLPARPANGTAVTLKLEARITAGYRWDIVSEPGALYTESSPPTFSMRYQGFGAPAIQTIQLKPTGTGNTIVHLVYQRSFGPKEPVYAQVNIWLPTAAGVELSDPTPVAPARDVTANQSGEEPDPLAELLPKALPTSWDWRTKGIVTPIRDQGGCGSCWAFATVGAMEAAVLKTGGPATDLSEQFLVSCNTEGWNCDGGWDSHEYHYNVLGKNQTKIGAVLESAKPYTASKGTCKTALSHPYKLTGWGYVGGLNSSNYWHSIPSYAQLKNAIYTYGPITTGVCAGSAFGSYRGGLFTTNEASICGISPNHMIVLVGWDDTDRSLILRNSWNTWWGESGYMRIKYGTSMVGIAPTWVTRVSRPGPILYKPAGYILTTKPTYVWSRVGRVASYKLQVYDVAAAIYRINVTVSSSYCNAATNVCTYTPSTFLTYGKAYKWRAAAADGLWGDWRPFRPVKILPTPAPTATPAG